MSGRVLPRTLRCPMFSLWARVHSERELHPGTGRLSGQMTPPRHDFLSPRRVTPCTDAAYRAALAHETNLQLTYQSCVIMVKCTAIAVFLGLTVWLLYGVSTALVPPEKTIQCKRQPIHNGVILDGTEGDPARIQCRPGYILNTIIPDDLVCRRTREICEFTTPPGDSGDVRAKTWVCSVDYGYTSAEMAKVANEHEALEYLEMALNSTFTRTYDFCSSGAGSHGNSSNAAGAETSSEQAFHDDINETAAVDAEVDADVAAVAAQYNEGQGQAEDSSSGEQVTANDAAVEKLFAVPTLAPAHHGSQTHPLQMLLALSALLLVPLFVHVAWKSARDWLPLEFLHGHHWPEYTAVSGHLPEGMTDEVPDFELGSV